MERPRAMPLFMLCAALLNPMTYLSSFNNSARSMFPSTGFQRSSHTTSRALLTTNRVAPLATDGDTDPLVKPGDDFYRYANGGWLAKATVPAGRQSYDTRAILADRTREQVRSLVQAAAATHSTSGTVAQKVGDYYASYMDDSAIQSKGLTPISREMASIAAIGSKAALSACLGSTLQREVDGLSANADHVFGLWVNQGFEDAEHNLPHLWQGGLGLPDRDNYLDGSAAAIELRTKYQTHIAAVFRLAGFSDPNARATRVLSLETRIAGTFAPDSDASDVFKQNNPWKRSDFDRKAPGMDWDAYFKAAGLATQSEFVVWQPSAVIGVSALVKEAAIEDWKYYLSFHLVEHYAAVLPKAINAEDLLFYGATLAGATQPSNRVEAAIDATNGALGQAVGQLYVQRYFSPEAKVKAETMVRNLITAYQARIATLSWMSTQTKEKALAKLSNLKIGVGYPDNWIDYSALNVVRGDAFGNMRRAEAFYHQRDLASLNKPVDPVEWPLNVQVPGAVITFSPNAEYFSAGLLQSPYFDGGGDSASNYGSAGAGIAHEISHSFDELGNIYDSQGRLSSWWSEGDRTRYRQETAKLAAQLSGNCPKPDLCVNGKQVLTESVADLAGLQIAHDAYVLSLGDTPDVVIGGLTGEQRFFIAFAQRWRKIQNEDALRKQIATDTHAPGEYRSDTVRNVDAWYKAFDVKPGDRLYLKPEDRVRIW